MIGLGVLAFWNWHQDYTIYNLEGWTGRYGKPFELLTTIHLATMAPDLAYEIAMNTDLDTKVNIKKRDVDFSYEMEMVVDETGDTYKGLDEINAYLDSAVESGKYAEDDVEKLKDKLDDMGSSGTIKTSSLYITSVERHWFRNVYFDTGSTKVHTAAIKDDNNEEEKDEGEAPTMVGKGNENNLNVDGDNEDFQILWDINDPVECQRINLPYKNDFFQYIIFSGSQKESIL